MNGGWEDGNLVFHLSLPGASARSGSGPGGPDSPDRLLLTPLGIAVTQPEAGLLVPGQGRTDLHEAARSGAAPGLAPVAVTGSWARLVLDELDRSLRGIDTAYGAAADAVIVVDAGPGVRADLLAACGGTTSTTSGTSGTSGTNGGPSADIIATVNAIARGIFAAGRSLTLTAARCGRHGVREPCPLQH